MTKNNIKAVFFASLIAAMILPFSMMEVSSAQEATENPSDNKGKFLVGVTNAQHEKMFELTKKLNALESQMEDSIGIDGISSMAVQAIMADAPTSSMGEDEENSIREHIMQLAMEKDIINELLEEKFNARIVSIGTDYENNALRVGLTNLELTDDELALVEDELRSAVGDDVNITLEKSDFIQLSCSQTGNCDPLQGGVKITADGATPCSTGYKAKFQNKVGFITSGHCMSSTAAGEKVYQPHKLFWDEPANRIGKVIKNTLALATSCDCAFVEETHSEKSMSNKVYNNIALSGTKNPVQFTWTFFEGHVTKGSYGGILDTYTVKEAKLGGHEITVYGLVETTATVTGGDSGGTVFEGFGSGTPEFMGIITGKMKDADGNWRGYYTPVNYIQAHFNGITFG